MTTTHPEFAWMAPYQHLDPVPSSAPTQSVRPQDTTTYFHPGIWSRNPQNEVSWASWAYEAYFQTTAEFGCYTSSMIHMIQPILNAHRAKCLHGAAIVSLRFAWESKSANSRCWSWQRTEAHIRLGLRAVGFRGSAKHFTRVELERDSYSNQNGTLGPVSRWSTNEEKVGEVWCAHAEIDVGGLFQLAFLSLFSISVGGVLLLPILRA